MNNEFIIKKTNETILNSYARFPLALKKGKGATVIDFENKKYIDFTSGIGVNSLGFCNKKWIKAVNKQLNTLQHSSNLYYTLPPVLLAEKLTTKSKMDKVFFANSGAESNECAIKCARKYSQDKYGENRYNILTLVNSFHGRTIATLSATGQDIFHKHFQPFLEGFRYSTADKESVIDAIDDTICAVMIEVIQGEGGVNNLSYEFIEWLYKYLKSKDILLIIDEVQTGIGRTGKLFAFQNFDIQPDIVTLAKGLGGGLPIGAVLFNKKTSGVLGVGMHATTFGANPVITLGANVVIDTITDSFLNEVREKGEYIKDKLIKANVVNSVSGMGMMLGLTTEYDSKKIASECLENGLLVLTAKDKIRLLPPLNISMKELDKGIKILIKTIKEHK